MSEAKASADKYAANVKSADDLLKQAQSYNSSLTSSSVVLSDTTYSSISSSLGCLQLIGRFPPTERLGEVGVIEVDGGYVVMYITATAHLDETRAVNVRHILFQFKSTDSCTTGNLTDEQKQKHQQQGQVTFMTRHCNSATAAVSLRLLQTATAMTPVQIPKAAFMRMLSPVRWLLSLTTGALIHQENPAIPI